MANQWEALRTIEAPGPDYFLPEVFTLANGEIQGIETSASNPKVRFDSTGFFVTDSTGDKRALIDTVGLTFPAVGATGDNPDPTLVDIIRWINDGSEGGLPSHGPAGIVASIQGRYATLSDKGHPPNYFATDNRIIVQAFANPLLQRSVAILQATPSDPGTSAPAAVTVRSDPDNPTSESVRVSTRNNNKKVVDAQGNSDYLVRIGSFIKTATVLTFANIPQGMNGLRVVIAGQSNRAGFTNTGLRFGVNGLGGTNYYFAYTGNGSAGAVSGNASANSTGYLGQAPAGSRPNDAYVSNVIIDFPNYASALLKSALAKTSYGDGTNWQGLDINNLITTAVPIDTITIADDVGGALGPNCTAVLYGY